MKDDELYETTIPGTPGRVTRGDTIIVSDEAFDRVTEIIESHEPNDNLKALMVRPDRFVGRDVTIEFAKGPPDACPNLLDFGPFSISGTLEIISWDEAVPCGDDAVSQGMLTRWLPLHNPAAPSKAFPNGFADVLYFPMRKGIRKIVIRRKPK